MNTCAVGTAPVKKDTYALSPAYSGEEKCVPGHFWGAGVRSLYLIHYVISGKGVFYCGPNKFTVQKGQIFVIFPDTIIKYQADTETPWHYAWVGFYGDAAKEIFAQVGISLQNPVFTLKNGSQARALLQAMPTERGVSLQENLQFSARLYAFMALLAESGTSSVNSKNVYLTTATEYIKAHYDEDITVDQIASRIGIGRKYLFALFKKSLGISPKDFILHCRIERAKEFLRNTQLPVGSIAYSVGYQDPLAFSKLFKLKTGLSPTAYRKKEGSV